VDSALVGRFAGVAALDIADLVGPLYTMTTDIRPLWGPPPPVVGRARTVKAWPGDNLAIHGALAMVEPGDVLVVDWHGHGDSAGAGSVIVRDARKLGLAAIVIDGAWRDLSELQAMGFPIFGRGVATFSPPKQRPGEVDVTVSCGHVVVAPGDLIVADADAVVVVPADHLAAVAEAMTATATSNPATRRATYEEAFRAAGGRAG
jgi:regulator of RNase E activity RraA